MSDSMLPGEVEIQIVILIVCFFKLITAAGSI